MKSSPARIAFLLAAATAAAACAQHRQRTYLVATQPASDNLALIPAPGAAPGFSPAPVALPQQTPLISAPPAPAPAAPIPEPPRAPTPPAAPAPAPIPAPPILPPIPPPAPVAVVTPAPSTAPSMPSLPVAPPPRPRPRPTPPPPATTTVTPAPRPVPAPRPAPAPAPVAIAPAPVPAPPIDPIPPAPAPLPPPNSTPAARVIVPSPASQPAVTLKSERADLPTLKLSRTGAADPTFIDLHDQYVQQAKAGDIDLYVLGASTVDFWQHRHKTNWDSHFAGWKAADFGIAGDRTENVLWRIQNGELDGVKPKVFVLLVGTNNLAGDALHAPNTPEETFAGIKAIVAFLRQRQPQAHILVMGVFPRDDRPLSDPIDQLNLKLSTLDDNAQVRFLNINARLTESTGKALPGTLLPDNLHPSDQGYDTWAEAMEPTLTQWLGKRPIITSK